MIKKLIRKALKSETPANSMYALIPKNRREAFRRFASFLQSASERCAAAAAIYSA